MCETVFGALLQPYWVVLLLFIWNIFTSIIVKLIINKVRKKEVPEDPVDYMDEIMVPSLYVVVPFTLLQVIHFVYIVVNIVIFKHDNNYTPWESYQAIGAAIMNSGFWNNFFQCVLLNFMKESDSDKKYYKVTLALIIIHLLVIGCWLGTHTIPMIIIYIWMVILLCLILLIPVIVTILIHPKDEDEKERTEESKKRVALCSAFNFVFAVRVSVFLFILILQTSYNYALLFYNGTPYLEVISTEWNLRNTACYIDNALETASSKFSLVSYIL